MTARAAPAAAVILAHADPDHLHRLVRSLEGLPIFVHIDRNTPDALFEQMVAGLPSGAEVLPRVRTALSSWSLVAAELAGLSRAMEASSAEHVFVMSGSCYPLVSMDQLGDELAPWRGHSRLVKVPVPVWYWNTRRRQDGGLSRFRYRHLHLGGQVLRIRGVNIRWPIPRAIPSDLQLHASSQWKMLARPHVQALLKAFADRPDLVKFWRTTFVPDESAVASMLASPAVVGDVAERVHNDQPWYLEWEEGADHPGWLTMDSAPAVIAAAEATAQLPGDARQADVLNMDRGRKIFARKFSTSRSMELLDLIDSKLRQS